MKKITTIPEKEAWHMMVHRSNRLITVLIFAGCLVLFSSLTTTTPVKAEDPPQSTEEYCLSCHSNPDLSITLPNGEELSLYIDQDTLEKSVHSNIGIECVACHSNITTYPHPEIEYNSIRELSRSYYLTCEKCHSKNYTDTLDSMHAEVAEAGNLLAPVCTDCHGAHYTQPPDEPRSLISNTCGHCHTDIYEIYVGSVHGSDLIEEENPDVPVCTDCHGVHNIHDPRTAQFRIDSPDLCANCHNDEELMSKYGLPSDVYHLYQLSWHGVDVEVYKARWPTIWHDSAVCTDCHGIHNILSTHDPDSMVNPDNLLDTCQKCHPDTNSNWTNAWTGHHEISFERTPILFYVDAFYSTFIPVTLILCIIFVILQIIRNTVERARRRM
jgi:predicted CXXCH cytochrome family protein